MKRFKKWFSIFLLTAIIFQTTSCTPATQANDLMKDVSPVHVKGKSSDVTFITSMSDFSTKLFKKTASDNKNTLISPLSVILALAMTANGADSETLTQMETLLGDEIPLTDLNEYLYSYVDKLLSGKAKLNLSNSIWFRDDESRLQVKIEFLQKNADYYNASVYKSAFDAKTLQSINNWVKTNTDGMIEKILDEIDEDTIMYLINTVVFDAEWENVYNANNIHEGEFTDINGKKQSADFMYSDEYVYLDDGMAVGFIKPYADREYSFVALLPNDDITIEEYIESLNGTRFMDIISNAKGATVNAVIPKFNYEYEVQLKDILETLGIANAFDSDKADFTKMAISSNGNIYIGEVLHKTYISVDELGTKAGAVTKIEMKDESAPLEVKTIRLDKPFVYVIIDNVTNLPIFIGTVMTFD